MFKGMAATAVVVMVCVFAALGQNDRARQDLGRSFRKFDLVKINGARSDDSRGSKRLSFHARGRNFELDLTPNDLRSYRYKSEDSLNPGVRMAATPEVRTFKGIVGGDSTSVVRLSIDGPKIEGYFVANGEKLYIERARKYTNQAVEGEFVVYKEEDSLVDNTFFCNADVPTRIESGMAGVTAQAATFGPASRILELATDADHEYVTALGGAAEANNEILSILNMADGVFQNELGIRIAVVYQHTWSTPDTYNASSMETILTSFGTHWNTNLPNSSVPRDAAHLFSGKTAARSAGLAWVGVICRAAAYSYGLSGYIQWAPGKFLVPTHELGHNFGGNHVDATQSCADTVMNAQLRSSTALSFCTFSRTEITTHATTYGSCLSNSPGPTPTPTPTVTPTPTPIPTPTPLPRTGTGTAFDFDGDSRSDIAVWRPSNGVWYLNLSSYGIASFQFGQGIDTAVPADYDGDGRTDAGVYRSGVWHRFSSGTNTYSAVTFGNATDIPVPADFDADGRADPTVFRPDTGVWYQLLSSSGGVSTQQWGMSGDVPLPADYDGDNRADINVFRPSNGTWYRVNSSTGASHGVQFGMVGDKAVTGDFDGDSRADVAVFRPSNGVWYILQSSSGTLNAAAFGMSGDIPTVGDYDGDRRSDISVFRPSDGVWYRLNSSTGGFTAAQFGVSADVPAAGAFIR